MYKKATDQISFYTALMMIVGAFAPASLCLASSSSPSPALVFDSTFVKVTARVLNLRQAPDNQAPLVGQLQYGQVVLSKERRSNWHHIETDSLAGWAFAPFLTPTDETPEWYKSPTPKVEQPQSQSQPQPSSTPSAERQPVEQTPEKDSQSDTDTSPSTPKSDQEPSPSISLSPEDIEQKQPTPKAHLPETKPLHTINLREVELKRWMEREELVNQLGEPTHASNTISIQHSKELLEYYTDDGRILYLYLANGFLTHWQLYRPLSQR
jgi:hypothetical protein